MMGEVCVQKAEKGQGRDSGHWAGLELKERGTGRENSRNGFTDLPHGVKEKVEKKSAFQCILHGVGWGGGQVRGG